MRLAIDQRRQQAARLLKELHGGVELALAHDLLQSPQSSEPEIAAQRRRVGELRHQLAVVDRPEAVALGALADAFLHRSIWIVGGDGWACDIGFGGLDHVLRSGQDVNVLVLDNGLYSSTGGQLSKATPRAAVAKFAPTGQGSRRKDLGHLAVTYRDVYVAQIAIGADPQQAVRAMLEAESYAGPSLVLAYSQCVVQGINMTTAMSHQKQIVQCGLWPLYRFDPRRTASGLRAMQLDCEAPKLPFKALAMTEARFALLAHSNPDHARQLFEQAQQDIKVQWNALSAM